MSLALENGSVTGAVSQFQCISSLILLTHPGVLKMIKEHTGAEVSKIQETSENGMAVWEKGGPHNLTEISLKQYVVTLTKGFDIDKFTPKIINGKLHASIVDITRVGAPMPRHLGFPAEPKPTPYTPPRDMSVVSPKVKQGTVYEIKGKDSKADERNPGRYQIIKDSQGTQFADMSLRKGDVSTHYRVYGPEHVIHKTMKGHISKHIIKELTTSRKQLISDIRKLRANLELEDDIEKKKEINQEIRVKIEELREIISSEYKMKT
jgi:hypothetical protein